MARLIKLINQVGHHNKYYNMEQKDGSPSWTATYGRIGQTVVTHTYPMSMWAKKYSEKLRHGYTDITAMMVNLGDVVRTPINKEGIVVALGTAGTPYASIRLESGATVRHHVHDLSHAYLDPDLFLHQVFYPNLLALYKHMKSKNTAMAKGGARD